MNIVGYVKKVNEKLNKRFPDSGSLTFIEFEVNNPFGVCELIIEIYQKNESNKKRKICSIAYIPDGLISDGVNQKITKRGFNEEYDMIEYTFSSISDNSLKTIRSLKYASMRLEKIYKDIKDNGQYYNGIIKNYKSTINQL